MTRNQSLRVEFNPEASPLVSFDEGGDDRQSCRS